MAHWISGFTDGDTIFNCQVYVTSYIVIMAVKQKRVENVCEKCNINNINSVYSINDDNSKTFSLPNWNECGEKMENWLCNLRSIVYKQIQTKESCPSIETVEPHQNCHLIAYFEQW